MLVAVGVAGLMFHCGAMFFVDLFGQLPFSDRAIDEVRALGIGSAALYVVPAGLVLLGLRRQHWTALLLVVLALAAVGVTMYDGSPLSTHLATIALAAVALSGTVAVMVLPPWAGTRASPV